jgi:hypothetical protein
LSIGEMEFGDDKGEDRRDGLENERKGEDG